MTESKNEVIILGCGCASGLPQVGVIPGGDWGKCNPRNPKNRRTRPSIYLNYMGNRILVDTSPDFRMQYLKNKLSGIDAVILTHAHSDHISGIDDLRKICVAQDRKSIPTYATVETFAKLEGTYGYLFKSNPNYSIYPQVLKKHIIEGDFFLHDHEVKVFHQPHGEIESIGLRFGTLAYSVDFSALSESTLTALIGIKTWIIDCLDIEGKKPTHSTLEQNLRYIEFVKPEKVYLTHMGKNIDYESIISVLPHNILPSYDGLKINF